MSNKLQQAISAIEVDNKEEARRLLIELLNTNPDEGAWWYMSQVAETVDEQRYCLRQVLKFNPGHEAAKKILLDIEQPNGSDRVETSPSPSRAEPSGQAQPAARSSSQPTSPDTRQLSTLSAALTTDLTQTTPRKPARPIAPAVPTSAPSPKLADRDVSQTPPMKTNKLTNKLGSIFRSNKTKQSDLAANEDASAREPESSPVEALIYSDDIWDYIADFSHMPSRQDRDRLVEAGDPKRVKIWDYFFRIDPAQIGHPHRQEIDQRHREKEAIHELHRKIAAEEKRIRPYRLAFYIVGGGLLGLWVVYNLFNNLSSLLSEIGSDSASQESQLPGLDWMTLFLCILPVVTIVGVGLFVFSQTRTRLYRRQLKKYAEQLRLITLSMPDVEMEAVSIKSGSEAEIIERRIDYLEAQIERLKAQIPPSPTDDEVRRWLDKDLKRLRADSIDEAMIENRLIDIAFIDDDDEQVVVSNPLVFLSPGELQSMERIPPPLNPIQPTSQPTEWLSNKLNLKPVPDRVKHLLARREMTTSSAGYDILFGVYYIEYLMIADDMLTMHGFFFDFITGKRTADTVTEQYYQDVVAIQKSKEFRTIPLSYNSDQTIDIEDAPTFSLTLPSGERRTVTLVNQDYLLELARTMGQVSAHDLQDIRQISERAKNDAEVAVKTLRHYLRLHKGAKQLA